MKGWSPNLPRKILLLKMDVLEESIESFKPISLIFQNYASSYLSPAKKHYIDL